MKHNLYLFFRSITPPFIWRAIESLVNSKYGWFGNYSSWEKARSLCSGYNAGNILEKVKDSTLKVKNGEAPYLRDSVLFDKIEYSWPLLAGLLWISSRKNLHLNLIDFGGSLGSTYFQNKHFLSHLSEMKWNVIEQENFVDCGKKFFQTETLRFYYSIQECLTENKPDVIILSSVLQYLEKPYELLEEIFRYQFEYLIIDLTAFIDSGKDRITVQKVPPAIYEASYPAWFFSEQKMLEFLETKYEKVADFEAYAGKELSIDGKILGNDKGFIFQIKS